MRVREPSDRSAPVAHRNRTDHGMVTAEAALVLPLVAAFALAMVSLVSIGVTKVSTVDAARDAARALARGEDSAAVLAQAQATGPDGAVVTIARTGDEVSVRVSVKTDPPAWFLVPLPAVLVESDATVLAEASDGID